MREELTHTTEDKLRRIEKLRRSEPLVFTGEEYRGKYELNNQSAEGYILRTLRMGVYINFDLSIAIHITKRSKKVMHHDSENILHLKSVAHIPALIENSIFIEKVPNEKGKNGFEEYIYFVAGLRIDGQDFTAKIVVGKAGNSLTYYDHALTPIEKGSLLDRIGALKGNACGKEAIEDSNIGLIKCRHDGIDLFPECKDRRLIQILSLDYHPTDTNRICLTPAGEIAHGGTFLDAKLAAFFETANESGEIFPENLSGGAETSDLRTNSQQTKHKVMVLTRDNLQDQWEGVKDRLPALAKLYDEYDIPGIIEHYEEEPVCRQAADLFCEVANDYLNDAPAAPETDKKRLLLLLKLKAAAAAAKTKLLEAA